MISEGNPKYTCFYFVLFLAVQQLRCSSRMIDALESHLKILAKQHAEIAQRLSATEVFLNLRKLRKWI